GPHGAAVQVGRRRSGFRRVHRGPRAALLQFPQDHHLCWLERDPEKHHLENDLGAVGAHMNFDYNEEQQLLADSVRRFLAKDYAFEARKKIVGSKEGWSPSVWAQLTEMGLMGL